MNTLINMLPVLLVMAIFWIGFAIQNIQIERMKKQIDDLETTMGELLFNYYKVAGDALMEEE